MQSQKRNKTNMNMKRNILTIIFTAALLTASANPSSNPFDTNSIPSIREAWTGKSIKVSRGENAPGIKEFTRAFCITYPQFDPNTAVKNYLDNPKGSTHPDVVNLELDTKNGYINYMACPTECCNYLSTCYWKRSNDHRLFAAFMQAEFENRQPHVLVVFYDYDPATDTMTPEPSITNMIEQRMAKYGSYAVQLPQEGKDITLIGYIIDEENDSATSEEQQLKWNGMNFE